MYQNIVIILRKFNYSKNSFIVLIPGPLMSLWIQIPRPQRSVFPVDHLEAQSGPPRNSQPLGLEPR